MLSKTKILGLGILGLLAATGEVQAQDGEDYLLEITKVQVMPGHMSEFMAGVKAYRDCYAENDGKGAWSFWRQVDGDQLTVHAVSRMENWAELDETDEVRNRCWENHSDGFTSHTAAVQTTYARRQSEWSGDPGEFTVVELHNFRVDDGEEFQSAVSEITGVLKEANYEDLGTWYDVIGGDGDDASYFVVEHHANFAAMDDDSPGVYGTVQEAKGEAEAKRMFDAFDASLRDDHEYWRNILKRVDSLSYSPENDS